MNNKFSAYYYQTEFIRDWPFTVDSFDRSVTLSADEKEALMRWRVYWNEFRKPRKALIQEAEASLERLIHPLDAALSYYGGGSKLRLIARAAILDYMCQRQTSFWAWNEEEWLEIIGRTAEEFRVRHTPSKVINQYSVRHCLIAYAYLLGSDVKTLICHVLDFRQTEFALHIFGTALLGQVFDKIASEIGRLGLGPSLVYTHMPRVVSESLLLSRCPQLESISYQTVQCLCGKYELYDKKRDLRNACITFTNILHGLGIISQSIKRSREATGPKVGVGDSLQPEWGEWIQRWYNTATTALSTRNSSRVLIAKAARWVTKTYPEVTSPMQWTRETCAAYTAEVVRMNAGDWAHPHTRLGANKVGKPLSATAKHMNISVVRNFFLDCQDWEWISVRFNPKRALATPKSIRNAIGTNPRVIANDRWAKLMHAALNLTKEDLPVSAHTKGKTHAPFHASVWYPFEMVKAVVLIWVFSGLRNNEIRRLYMGCIRWQDPEGLGDGNEVKSKKPICLLSVPTNKTSKAFVKPVDPLVGHGIQAWEKIRPDEPKQQDSKTGEQVHFLFVWRGKKIGDSYLNLTIIPMLCKKAGIPIEDALGTITSHRARSTIASQLYNASDGMSFFDLQDWLGHSSPASTQHYVKITPTKLANSYSNADYFKTNMRLVQILVDQEVIRSGAAADGEPWLLYDLGHGYCTLPSFNQCAHRMACAKCSFYRPKESSYIQMLEAKSHNLRLQQEIPLTDEESTALTGDMEAFEKLTMHLQNVPTPQGPTPRELSLSIPMPPIQKSKKNL